MKNLIVSFLVIVTLNNGNRFVYPKANQVITTNDTIQVISVTNEFWFDVFGTKEMIIEISREVVQSWEIKQ